MHFEDYVLYGIVKYFAYAAWCMVGVKIFQSIDWRTSLKRGAGYGFARLFMGIGFGLIIFFVAVFVERIVRNENLTYLLVYIPVRFLEWAIMVALMGGESKSNVKRAFLWILGGVIISCIADLPFDRANNPTLGRIFC